MDSVADWLEELCTVVVSLLIILILDAFAGHRCPRGAAKGGLRVTLPIGSALRNLEVTGNSVRNAEPSGAKGSERSRIPVAAKIAFPTAGASPTIGVSPAPPDGKYSRSSISISISGVSLNRGTRYPARCGLSM